MLKSLSGPYSHMGLKFMPTGGVTLDNMNGLFGVVGGRRCRWYLAGQT